MIEAQKQLKQVQPDMSVYDNTGQKVGKVSFVHTGADEYIADWHTVAPDVEARTVPPEVLDELPGADAEAINRRLLQLGFVKIKTGLLSPTRYALPEHIAQVLAGDVHLSVEKDELPAF